MSHTDFKNRIDALMNILWSGGVANHSTIIEQINYLVFLRSLSKRDDHAMRLDPDAEQVFQGKLAHYHWDSLLVLNAEALFVALEEVYQKLPELTTNKTINLLYRDAHVKVFDKPTLRRLVHEIEQMMRELEEEASSGHTDIFGDMYEYLLGKLAQAGTLGSFRTPRNIIKFVVDVVDPNKGETILDPACGTAGFLVAALEHLKEKYSSEEFKKEDKHPLDLLAPEERRFLFQHTFSGFDSDFDMFKFGLMNLYLHQLEHPNIKRINTLVDTAGDRTKWDIVLANPPFSGAIDKSSISEDLQMGTRATELLFLRYIMDHLSSNGRSGVIVPEGVLYSGSNAHIKIRQMLVEDAGLWAVVSLPAGIFNPYAGVKTSILFFDKSLKNKVDHVLFLNVNNDGFDLGATKRPINKNDLPKAKELLLKYRKAIEAGEDYAMIPQFLYLLDDEQNPADRMAGIIEKSAILETKDHILSMDRYEKKNNFTNSIWPQARLGDLIAQRSERVKGNHAVVWSVSNTVGFIPSEEYFDKKVASENIQNYKIIKPGYFAYNPSRINVGSIASNKSENTGSVSPMYVVFEITSPNLDPDYFINFIKSKRLLEIIKSKAHGSVREQLKFDDLAQIDIPLPPLSIQREAVEQIESKRNLIIASSEVVKAIKKEKSGFGLACKKLDCEWVEIGSICEMIQYGTSDKPNQEEKGYKVLRMNDLVDGEVIETETLKHVELSSKDFAKYKVEKGDILFNRTNSIDHVGRTGIFNLEGDYCFASYLIRMRVRKDCGIKPAFLNLFMNSEEFQTGIKKFASRAIGQANINAKSLGNYKVPLAPLDFQNQALSDQEEDNQAISINKSLIARYEIRIQNILHEL